MTLMIAAIVVPGLWLAVVYLIAFTRLNPPPSNPGRWAIMIVAIAALGGRLGWLAATRRLARSPRTTTIVAIALSLAGSLVCVNLYWWLLIGSLYMDTEIRYHPMFPNFPSLAIGLVGSLGLSVALARSLASRHE
jgi:hypothetical protein